ncbi:MAG: primosomal protein N' [Thermodesulfovibrionales bacterium]|nr:primosomal protein N' [Thermodesulfovibrionales bacterium]
MAPVKVNLAYALIYPVFFDIMHAEVVFPLKLPPLTYKIPNGAPTDLIGRIVKAPLINKSLYGLIASLKDEAEIGQQKNIREIHEISRHFTSDAGILFLKWLSDYYLMPMGIALKSCFFEEMAASLKKEDRGQTPESEPIISTPCEGSSMIDQNVSVVFRSIMKKNYQTFLFHAPSIAREYLFISKILAETCPDSQRAIILVPEIGHIERLSSSLSNMLGERLCILHSKLGKVKRIEAIRRIVSGKANVILGTRSAMLAPLNDIAFIAVLSEHSPSYKAEEGLRYNARDVAVMRGFMGKSCVLLSSVCPSMESVYNAKTGKYAPLTPEPGNQKEQSRPKIKIVGMNAAKQRDLSVSGEILQEAKKLLLKNGKLLFIASRSGYSIMTCEDCNEIFRCKKCQIPLVFYKSRGILRCNYCGIEKTAGGSCEKCQGFNIKPFGAGTERIKDEVEKLLKTGGMLLEKKAKGLKVKNYDLQNPELSPFVIGTAYASKRAKEETFSSAVLLNMDCLLSQPDFRAYERIFQETLQISQLIKPDGYIFIQTRDARNIIWKFIRNYDLQAFYNYEMSQRNSLNYPPFSKMILFNIIFKNKSKKISAVSNDIQKIIAEKHVMDVDILTNMNISSADKSYEQHWQILLKSRDRKALHIAAKNLMDGLKKLKEIKLTIDVDPVKI